MLKFIKRKHQLLSVICFLLCSICFLFAQTDKIAFEKYGVSEGLPEASVFNVTEDKQGFIWFTTLDGIVRFDGYSMTVYKQNPNNPTSHHMDMPTNLLVASDHTIWFENTSYLSEGGLCSFNPKTEKFSNYPIVKADSTKVPFKQNRILFEDSFENIWFTSYGDVERFLCKINIRTKVVSRYPSIADVLKSNDLVLNYIMAESKIDSTIWIVNNDNAIQKYNKAADKFDTVFKKWDVIPGTNLKDSITDINYASKSGLVTLANNDRLYLLDPLSKKVTKTYEFKNRSTNSYGAHFEDSYGNLWISSYTYLTLINPNTNERQDFKFGEGPLEYEVIGQVEFLGPQVQNKDYLYFSVTSRDDIGLSYYYTLRYNYNTESFNFYDYKFNDQRNLHTRNTKRSVKYMLDKTGLLWLSKSRNLFKEAPKKRQIEQYNYVENDANSLPSNRIFTLFEDSKKRLWVGTERGLTLKQEDGTFKRYFYRDKDGMLKSLEQVNEIFQDTNGRIWIGTRINGLLRLDENTQEFVKYSFKIGLNIWHITEGPDGNIWVSDYYEGITVLNPKTGTVIKNFHSNDKNKHGLALNRTSDIFLDANGSLWLFDQYSNSGLYKFIKETNTFKHYKANPQDSLALRGAIISGLAKDRQNRLWVATSHGLHWYDHDQDVFHRNKITGRRAANSQLIKGNDEDLWVRTYAGDGLAHVDIKKDTLEFFGEEQGLLHNDATNLIIDNNGKIWLPTNRGLSVFDTKTKTFSNFFEKDGFQEYGSSNPILKTSDGHIWIGGANGLNDIDPKRLFKVDSTVPKVLITKMGVLDSVYSKPDGILFNKAVSYAENVELEHWQKDVSFSFVGLHYLRPEDNHYSWKLENYDTHWSTPSKDRTTSYTNLSPGSYTFRVKASNADGVWNDAGASIEVIILPPWWQTWWAYTIYAFILGFLGYRIHYAQKLKTIRKEREKAHLKELEQAKEIEKAYTELKSTQDQLIQSEKMASLGELTAGIAHEIQNPLNFVNNFSEVSHELIDEMQEELNNGELDEAKTIADDVKQNLEKITFHGKRADSIVKGMLQHSRNNTGEKELVDLNKLTDEYMRLAFHGHRAKNKSFNAELETDFDKTIGKIEIVPQDIGRVILNLFNNAFYAVDKKKKKKNTTDTEYAPMVSVRTKKHENSVLITIKDNGGGIPKSASKKIFDPFFTTKPTGKGTGLGLSMSYDIIKSHGGTLSFDTKEGEYTVFEISLPLKAIS